jgi:2-oxoglutarate dehydrogenase E1 component
VARLIQVYSLRGHQIADLDPLGIMDRRVPGVLKLDYLGLTEADMDTEFSTGGLAGTGDERMKLRDILGLLKSIYCGKIGAEFAHVSRSHVLVSVYGCVVDLKRVRLPTRFLMKSGSRRSSS